MSQAKYDEIADWYHENIQAGIQPLINAGLILERLVEPPGIGETAKLIPGYKEVPVSVIVRCRKNSEILRTDARLIGS